MSLYKEWKKDKKDKVNDAARKRKLDELIQSYIDNPEEVVEKKPKLDNESFKKPLDDIDLKELLTKNCVHDVVHLKSVHIHIPDSLIMHLRFKINPLVNLGCFTNMRNIT